MELYENKYKIVYVFISYYIYMTIDSPLTEYIIEPFDSYIESKNNLKYNKFALIQLLFVFLIISF